MNLPGTGRSGCRNSFLPSLAAKMDIIAHRGASHEAPENTLAAVRLAWEQGADAVEVDVQLSKDSQPVVIHDEDAKRTAGVAGKVSDQTLDRLRRLDVGRWKGEDWIGEKIPTLDEVLAMVPRGKRLFVEFKCGPPAIPEFKAALERSGTARAQVVAIGFSEATMKAVKTALREMEVCWISRFKRNWNTGQWLPTAEQLIKTAKHAGLDGVDLDAGGPVDVELVKELKAAKLKTYVWTVDSPTKARRLAKAGVDGLTTNRPGWLRQKLAN